MDSFRDKFSMVQSLEIEKRPHVWMTRAFLLLLYLPPPPPKIRMAKGEPALFTVGMLISGLG